MTKPKTCNMKITRVLKFAGILFICVSGSFKTPIFYKVEKKQLIQIEQREWEYVNRQNDKKRYTAGDVQRPLKEEIMLLVGGILQHKETLSTPKTKKEKLIRSFPPRKKVFV